MYMYIVVTKGRRIIDLRQCRSLSQALKVAPLVKRKYPEHWVAVFISLQKGAKCILELPPNGFRRPKWSQKTVVPFPMRRNRGCKKHNQFCPKERERRVSYSDLRQMGRIGE